MGEHEYNVLDCGYTLKETKEYLCSVIKEKYTEEQIRQIFKALKLAFCAHEGQLRCNGEPYIIHPMRVALMLLKFDRDTISKVFIGALLHDTVEKADIGLAEIEEKFGGYVAELVRSVTREHEEKQSPQEKTEAKYQNWLKVIS
ncbi:MAG TPA: HD domain-containing protein, partial [Ktedonobacteraceae bacterium]|nr:HD domain-containing protein [Ktedonobacteraceae bacterium]